MKPDPSEDWEALKKRPRDVGLLGPLADAVNDWFWAYIGGKVQKKKARIAHEIARQVPKAPDHGHSPQVWAYWLARHTLDCEKFGSKQGDTLLVTLINSNRARIAWERPNEQCKRCGFPAWQGGGPMCECDK